MTLYKLESQMPELYEVLGCSIEGFLDAHGIAYKEPFFGEPTIEDDDAEKALEIYSKEVAKKREEKCDAPEEDPVEEPGADFFEEKPESTEDAPLDSWYTDIGKKIKGWAKWIFILEAIAAVIGALVMLVTAEDWVVSFAALLALFVGPFVAWVSSWLLYAFGELVDKTAANERNTQNILKFLQESREKEEEK